MGESATDRLWDMAANDPPSPYARMIPGILSMATTVAVPIAASGVRRTNPAREPVRQRALTRTFARPYAPQPGIARFFCRAIAADLGVLFAVCAGLALFFPALALPLPAVPVFAFLVTLICFSQGLYQTNGDPSRARGIAVVAQATLGSAGLVFISGSYGIRLGATLMTFVTGLAALVLSRQLQRYLWRWRSCDSEARKILIVGAGPVARSIAHGLRNDPLQRAMVCGFVDDELPLSPAVLGRIDDLEWLARSEFIDEVILALPGQATQTRRAAEVALRNHLDIRAVPDLPPGPWPDSGVDHIGEVPVITLHREPLPNAALVLKRWLDVIGSGLGLLLASPLMAVVALLIRLDSAGPVLYCAERAGAKGHRFRCYKFRSMVTNAAHLKEDLRTRNQRQGPIFKIEDDPRITRVGRFLRRYSLDELPQLWNVLCGEMSLVGPRPHPVDEVNHYDLQHLRRLDVKPGITGLWQITARGCPSFELNMHLDLTYIENWSLRLDLRILAGTIPVLFAPEGA